MTKTKQKFLWTPSISDQDYVEGAMSTHGKFAVIADAHIGPVRFPSPNPRVLAQARVDAFRRAVKRITATGVRSIVIAGDLFDGVVIPPGIVQEMGALFNEYANYGIQFVLILGNHERDILEHAGSYVDLHVVPVLDTDPMLITDVQGQCSTWIVPVPYSPVWTAKQAIQTGLRKGRDFDGTPQIMVGHFGLYDDDDPGYMKHDPWFVPVDWLSDECSGAGVSLVLCGHLHQAKVWNRNGVRMISIGSLSPTSAKESGRVFGNVAIVGNLETVTRDSYGKVKVDLYTNENPGVRYVAGEDLEQYTVEDLQEGNWLLVTSEPSQGLLPCWYPPFSIPETVEETRGAVTQRWAHTSDVLPVRHTTRKDFETPVTAITRYVTLHKDKMKGPIQGLKTDAVSRVVGGGAASKLEAIRALDGLPMRSNGEWL
jgi:DNA repair exonuclease SbcCD nuclease subunit